jgi:hypothetical protein
VRSPRRQARQGPSASARPGITRLTASLPGRATCLTLAARLVERILERTCYKPPFGVCLSLRHWHITSGVGPGEHLTRPAGCHTRTTQVTSNARGNGAPPLVQASLAGALARFPVAGRYFVSGPASFTGRVLDFTWLRIVIPSLRSHIGTLLYVPSCAAWD